MTRLVRNEEPVRYVESVRAPAPDIPPAGKRLRKSNSLKVSDFTPARKSLPLDHGLLQSRLRRLVWLLVIFSLVLLAVLICAVRLRYGIVHDRIGDRMDPDGVASKILGDVCGYLRSTQWNPAGLTSADFTLCYLVESQSFRGAQVVTLQRELPLAARKGARVIAIARPLVESGSLWYWRAGGRRVPVRNCTLFVTILHEVVHHTTKSHEEALCAERHLLAHPPRAPLCGERVTPEDWSCAMKIIREYIREL